MFEVQLLEVSCASDLAQSLCSVGAFRREALDVIYGVWSKFHVADSKRWFADVQPLNSAIKDEFEKKGWLAGVPAKHVDQLLKWPMPLYPFDLGLDPV